MRPSQCWAWARTAAEHRHSPPLWVLGCPARLPASSQGGDTPSPPQQIPGCGAGAAAAPLLVAPGQGSRLAGLGAACVGSVRCGRAVGIDEIKVPAPAKSQRLLRGRAVQGGLMRLGRRRGWDSTYGAGSVCQAGEGAVAVVLRVGQEEPTGAVQPWGHFPGFSPVWACTGSKRCWFKSHLLGPLVGTS